MTSPRPFTVAISGTSGAGKSTLVRALAEAYEDDGRPVAVVRFDEHLSIEAKDLPAWMADGGDPNAWRTDSMLARLVELRSSPPMEGGVILVEEPFGRARTTLSSLLDLVIYLDLGLHLALARRMLRDFVPAEGTLTEEQRVEAHTYLTTYVDVQARAYAHLAVLARSGADLKLDATQPTVVLVDAVRAALRARADQVRISSPVQAKSLDTYSRTVPGGRGVFLTTRLWALSAHLPVRQVPLTEIVELDRDCWFDHHPATIRSVADHARRINEADRTYPVVLAADGTLMDGGHRLAQASLRGDTTIAAVRFDVDPEPDWVKPR